MQVAVLGLGTFGSRVAEVLSQKGVDVLAIDSDPQRVEALKDRVDQAVILDARDEMMLRRAGLAEVDAAVVALGANSEATILLTATLRRLGIARIVARCDTPMHAEILREVGAFRVLLLEHQMAEQLAEELAAPYMLSRRVLETGHVVADVRAPRSIVGRTLGQIELRRRFGLSIVAVRRREPAVSRTGENFWRTHLLDGPGPDVRIEEEDVLLVIGRPDGIERMVEAEETSE